MWGARPLPALWSGRFAPPLGRISGVAALVAVEAADYTVRLADSPAMLAEILGPMVDAGRVDPALFDPPGVGAGFPITILRARCRAGSST